MNNLTATKEEIGNHLKKLIANKGVSQAQFCRDYLSFNGSNFDVDQLNNMKNRLSQIINGKNDLQREDLLIFANLLDTSCEDILSAGKIFAPKSDRLTNYSIAFSDDTSIWDSYINHPNNLILQMDEYGKTAIDYAFEFRNSKFLNYLIDKGYIWFEEKGGFSANSSIKSDFYSKYSNPNNCYLNSQLDASSFREKIIALAISENDIELLTKMHAREIPELHYLSANTSISDTKKAYYLEEINENIIESSDNVISYFIDEFIVEHDNIKSANLMYPFMSKLLDNLIKSKNKAAKKALNAAITHNTNTYTALKEIIEKSIQEEYSRLSDLKEEAFEKEKPRSLNFILSGFCFSDEYNIVSFRNHYLREELTTNIVKITEISNDEEIKQLTTTLNEVYEKIRNIKLEFNV